MSEPIDRGALRALAEKATPGPWEHGADEDPPDSAILHDGCAVFDVAHHANMRTVLARGEDFSRADARYIAAVSPTVVVALLDALDAAERAAVDVVAATAARIRGLEESVKWHSDAAQFNRKLHDEICVKFNALAEEHREAEAALAQARADVRRFGIHECDCASERSGVARDCDCGYREALERAEGSK